MWLKRDNYLIVSFLLLTSTLYITYFVDNLNSTKYLEVGIFIVLLLLYFRMPKIPIRNSNNRVLYFTTIAFGCVYLLRAFWDLWVMGEKQQLFTNDITVFFYVINGIIIPLTFLPRAKYEGNFGWAFCVTGIILLFALFYSVNKFLTSDIQQAYRDQMFGANDNISVIEYGYLGLTAALIGVTLLLYKNKRLFFRVVAYPLIAVGIISIFLSGTRGAMVGAFVITALFALSTLKRKYLVPFLLFFFVLVYYSQNIIDFAESYGVGGSVSRIFRLITEEGDQSSGRTGIWFYALNQVMESPILGISCFFQSPYSEVPYVHNSFIEVFYALGVMGAFVFIVANYIAIKTCIRIFRGGDANKICIAFLYLEYFVLSLFSNSILRLPLYWYFLSLLFCISNNEQYEKSLLMKMPKAPKQ